MLEDFKLEELSNIELLYRVSQSDDPMIQELLSRIEFCVHSNISNHSVLAKTFKYANEVDDALQVIRDTFTEDGEIFGYMPYGLYKAPRENGEFYWEGY